MTRPPPAQPCPWPARAHSTRQQQQGGKRSRLRFSTPILLPPQERLPDTPSAQATQVLLPSPHAPCTASATLPGRALRTAQGPPAASYTDYESGAQPDAAPASLARASLPAVLRVTGPLHAALLGRVGMTQAAVERGQSEGRALPHPTNRTCAGPPWYSSSFSQQDSWSCYWWAALA